MWICPFYMNLKIVIVYVCTPPNTIESIVRYHSLYITCCIVISVSFRRALSLFSCDVICLRWWFYIPFYTDVDGFLYHFIPTSSTHIPTTGIYTDAYVDALDAKLILYRRSSTKKAILFTLACEWWATDVLKTSVSQRAGSHFWLETIRF